MGDILKAEQLLEHVDFLKSLARRLVGADAADDLVQDTLVSALSSETRPRSLRAWLARIARNRAVSRWRKNHARRDKERCSTTPPDLPGPSE
ncbi:MAG: sigma factor, partial [Planctomycetota bacterium]